PATATSGSRRTATTARTTSTLCSTLCGATALCSLIRLAPMLLREVEYARPGSIDEAVRLLSSHDNARPLAGGQSLVNVMKIRVASPDVVVDLAKIPELREIHI